MAVVKPTVGQTAWGASLNLALDELAKRENHSGVQAISTITNLQTTLNGKVNSAEIANMVVSGPEVGPLVLLRDGIDTPSGAVNEIILSTGSGASGGFSALDTAGGIVGCTVGDPAMASIPLAADTETTGNVIVVGANTRVGARFTLQGTRIDQINWHVGDGSTAGTTGVISICRGTDGVVIAQSSRLLTPNPVTAPGGNTVLWGSIGLTGLTPGAEYVIVVHHTTGTIRYAARGIPFLANATGTRTFAAGSGELHRAGRISAAPATPAIGQVVDLTTTAAWAKSLVPVFVVSRTAA